MRLRRLSLFLPGLALLLAAVVVDAQNAPSLAGRWEGTLVPEINRGAGSRMTRRPPPLPMVVTIMTASNGTHVGTWASTAQNDTVPINSITIEGDTIRVNVLSWRGLWEGKLSADGTTLDGTWKQNGRTPRLVLKRVAAR
jgi:hypothetical protein